MKKIVFRVDGSTGTDSMRTIYNAVKEQFPKAKKEEVKRGVYSWDCYITVPADSFREAFHIVKGFASHAMEAM